MDKSKQKTIKISSSAELEKIIEKTILQPKTEEVAILTRYE